MVKAKERMDASDRGVEAADAMGEVFERYAPRAVDAVYRLPEDKIAVTLSSGIEIAFPRGLLVGLKDAEPGDVGRIAILSQGATLHWEALDVEHRLAGLLHGVFGNRNWMSEIGRRGGTAQSAAKRAAAQKNGRKGGRPRGL